MEENNQEIINSNDTDKDKDNQYLFNFISSHFNDLIQVYLIVNKDIVKYLYILLNQMGQQYYL